jgi:hypothetical protein
MHACAHAWQLCPDDDVVCDADAEYVSSLLSITKFEDEEIQSFELGPARTSAGLGAGKSARCRQAGADALCCEMMTYLSLSALELSCGNFPNADRVRRHRDN